MTKVDVKYYVRDAIRQDTLLSTESRGQWAWAQRSMQAASTVRSTEYGGFVPVLQH